MTTWSFVAVPSTFKLVVYNLYTVKKNKRKSRKWGQILLTRR